MTRIILLRAAAVAGAGNLSGVEGYNARCIALPCVAGLGSQRADNITHITAAVSRHAWLKGIINHRLQRYERQVLAFRPTINAGVNHRPRAAYKEGERYLALLRQPVTYCALQKAFD